MADTWRNDPVPDDVDVFDETADPIKIGSGASTTVTGISTDTENPQRITNIPDLPLADTPVTYDEAGRPKIVLAPVGRAEQTGTTGRSVSRDAPEDPVRPTTLSDRQLLARSDRESIAGLSAQGNNSFFTGFGEGSEIDPTVTVKEGNPVDSIQKKPLFTSFPVPIDVRPNELNQFSSYTYNISLYMLNSKSYVNLLTAPNNPQAVLNDSLLLMRSGGVGLDNTDSELERELGFFNNFFIDDLEISCVAVGPSKFRQNTNATDIRFNIFEPRGVTLLERLRNAAASTLASTRERYITAPYLLEITFKGYDETGAPLPAPSRPKYIPIRIVDIEFDVSEAGTQYKVQAIPFANNIFGKIDSTIPTNIEIKASKVGDIFSNTIQTVIGEETRYDDDSVNVDDAGTTVTRYGETSRNLGDILTDNQVRRTKETTVSSDVRTGPPSSSGGYETVTVPPQAEGYNTYTFAIASEIAEAKLNIDELYDALNSPQPKGEGNTDGKANKSQFQAYVAGLRNNVVIDKEQSIFRINAGTDIVKLLNLIIMHSDYMDQNVADGKSASNDPIKFFKVKPVILSAEGPGKGYDSKDGRYKYHIQYTVTPSFIFYNDFPWAPKGIPQGNGIHKVYNYIFSGTNTDVLDFNLKFRTAFVQTMTQGTGSPYADKPSSSDFVPEVDTITQSLEGNTINNPDSLQRARAKDLFSSVMSDGVDMVDLELSIIGDPSYIPTSDAYWQDRIRQGQVYNDAYMPDGTINYDYSPPYVQVNLRTPVDYDDTTGLAEPSRFGNSSFSGVYRVTSVDSTFSSGVFEQKVYGFRPPVQRTRNGGARDNQQLAAVERTGDLNARKAPLDFNQLLGDEDE